MFNKIVGLESDSLYNGTEPSQKLCPFLTIFFNGICFFLFSIKKLLTLNLDPSLPIMKAHGVPEISQYLSKSINLDECIFMLII